MAMSAARVEGAGSDAPSSIHDVVRTKEAGLSDRLHYDPYERRSGLVRFLASGTTPEDWATGRAVELGDAVDRRVRAHRTRARTGRRRAAGDRRAVRPCASTKSIVIGGDRRTPTLSLTVDVTNDADEPVEGVLGLEWTIMLLGGGGNPSAWFEVDGVRGSHDGSGTSASVDLVLPGQRLRGRIDRDRPLGARGALVGAGRDGLEFGGRLRARLSGSRHPDVVAAEPGARRDEDGHGQPHRRHLRRSRRGRARGRRIARVRVSRGHLVVHGHFYQPSRVDPFSGDMLAEPSAAPAHDWTERISTECYRPNAELGNLGRMSWDLGPTLADWLERCDPVAYDGFVEGDAGINGLAQPYHHTIMPLASAADRRTEIAWGLRDFAWRFGRPATGVWLPEGAVDLPTLRLLAGPRGPAHDPRPVAGRRAARRDPPALSRRCRRRARDRRRPVRRRPVGRDLVRAAGDRRCRCLRGGADRATARFGRPAGRRAAAGRDRHGRRAVRAPPAVPRSVPRATPRGRHTRDEPRTSTSSAWPTPWPSRRAARSGRRGSSMRTSWSCHHGIHRWSGECACAPDGRWKAPLRAALERLAAGIDVVTERVARAGPRGRIRGPHATLTSTW